MIPAVEISAYSALDVFRLSFSLWTFIKFADAANSQNEDCFDSQQIDLAGSQALITIEMLHAVTLHYFAHLSASACQTLSAWRATCLQL